jgi:hypothetical protein
MMGSSGMGRYSPGYDEFSALGTGIIRAPFHPSGKVPSMMHRFIRREIDLAILDDL